MYLITRVNCTFISEAVLLTERKKLSIYTSTEESATISEVQTVGRREKMLSKNQMGLTELAAMKNNFM